MEIEVRGDIESGIRQFKKDLGRSGQRQQLKLKSIPKRSERRKEKARLARMKRRKREKIEGYG